FVPQGHGIFRSLTVEDNLELGAFSEAETTRLDERRGLAYEMFPMLRERARQIGGTLSGGQQQMLAIGMALMHAPKLMIVAGASGLVGFAAVRHFMGLPGWEVVGLSRRIPTGLEQARILSLDLLDRGRCAEVLGAMRDVTHVVYAALYEKPGLIPGWRDPE